MLRPGDVISAAYVAQQRELHARPQGFGGKGDKWAPATADLVIRFDAWSVLDYGCGQGRLRTALRALVSPAVRIDEYDPGVPGKDSWPEFADLLVCTDVLEHVEPELLGNVLAHLHLLARKAVFVVVATRPSNKTLPDGRNAHLIQEPAEWWAERMSRAGFDVFPGPPSPLDKQPSREWVAVLQPVPTC